MENCIVCNAKIPNSSYQFCPQCDCELIVISKSSSDELKKYYNDKIAKHEKQYRSVLTLNEQAKIQSGQIKVLNEQIADLKKTIADIEYQKNSMHTESLKQKQIEIEKKDSRIKQLETSLKTLNDKDKTIEELKIKLAKCLADCTSRRNRH